MVLSACGPASVMAVWFECFGGGATLDRQCRSLVQPVRENCSVLLELLEHDLALRDIHPELI